MFYHDIKTTFTDVPNKTMLAIYTVGCEHKCKGCHVPYLQSFKYSRGELQFSRLLNMFQEDFHDGILLLGGDPLLQLDATVYLTTCFKSMYPDKLTVAFTGYKVEDFTDNDLKSIDYVVDGKWQGIPYNKPETNQRIYSTMRKSFLTYSQYISTQVKVLLIGSRTVKIKVYVIVDQVTGNCLEKHCPIEK